MEGPRAARADELQQVLGLINNTFRTSNGFAPTMGEEFPLLLCEDNLDNIRIITDNGKPVSDINYYRTNILIQGSAIKASSIGAVCTAPEYRGQNLASTILDDVEARLKKDNVDVLLVSGSRNLYLRRGCCIVGGFLKAAIGNSSANSNIPSGAGDSSAEVVIPEDGHLWRMAEIYGMEPVRYYRSLYEFEYLLKGATTPWNNLTYKVFIIKRKQDVVGYVVLRIVNDGSGRGIVVEYAGDRETVYKSFYKIMKSCSLKNLIIYISDYDPIKAYFKNDGIELIGQNQLGTVKIICFESFMNNLKPYFMQYLPYKSPDCMSFKENEEGYSFSINGEELCISDLDMVSQLIFGSRNDETSDKLDVAMAGKPLIKQFFDTVFPIPFPWAGNVNYI